MRKLTAILLAIAILIPTAAGRAEPVSTDAYRVLPLKQMLESITPDKIEAAYNKLYDIRGTWNGETIAKLVNLEIIGGNPDGSFSPDATIQVDAFIKMAVKSLGYVIEQGDEYWAEPFIKVARDEKLIDPDEFTDMSSLERPITREEMAKIAIRTVMLKEAAPYQGPEAYLRNVVIQDYAAIGDKYKQSVLTGFNMGLLTGYSGGEFRGQDNLTRAEAAEIIYRGLDNAARRPHQFGENEVLYLTYMKTYDDEEGYLREKQVTDVVYPYNSTDEIIFANALKRGLAMTSGYYQASINTPNILEGGTMYTNWYESEQKYKEDSVHNIIGGIDVAMGKFSGSSNFCNATIYYPAEAKQYYRVTFEEVFKIAFPTEWEQAMAQLDRFFDMGVPESVISENYVYDGRKINFHRFAGDIRFTVFIYKK